MGLSATDITRLEDLRTATVLELNTLASDTTKSGNLPNMTGAGASVDQTGYEDKLWRRLEHIDEQLSSGSAVGGFEAVFEVQP